MHGNSWVLLFQLKQSFLKKSPTISVFNWSERKKSMDKVFPVEMPLDPPTIKILFCAINRAEIDTDVVTGHKLLSVFCEIHRAEIGRD